MPVGEHQIRNGRKVAQVLDGARAIVLNAGFDGASVDDFARAAGLSKATLYRYFPDKRLLFMEVTRIECRGQADTALALIDLDAPIAVVLTDVAQQRVSVITSDFGLRIFRICLADSDLDLDLDLAADQFQDLCKAHLFMRLVFNLTKTVSQADRDRVASDAVAAFMARYGT